MRKMGFFKIPEKHLKWWILFAMATPSSMIFIDVTVLPVALPTMQRELGLSNLGLQWIVNAYTFLLAVCVLGSGRLGDMWGLKKAFCLGLGLFAFASFLCGMASSEWWIITTRGFQGIGASLLVPASQGILYASFPPHQRGKALGLLVSISAIFLSIGPLLGGMITQYLSWRYVFWINIPIALAGFMLALPIVPKFPGRKESFDFLGFGTLAISMSALIIAMMEVQNWGWSSPLTLSLLLLGVFLPFFFFRVEREVADPIVDFSILRKRSFWAGASAISLAQFSAMVGVFWAIYFQEVLFFSPTLAGTFAFIANAPVLLGAPIGGYLVDRFGPRRPVSLGFSLILFSLLCFIVMPVPLHHLLLIFVLIPYGFGVPMIYTPSYVSLLSEVPSEKRGSTSGINISLRQFSCTLGLAIFGTLFSSIQNRDFSLFLASNPETSHLNPPLLEGVLSHTPHALEVLSTLSPTTQQFVLSSARSSFISGFTAINCAAACSVLFGLLVALRFMKRKNSPSTR